MNLSDQVTIGIPVYNEAKFLAQTLASAAKQDCGIIISDNCSTDSTRSICEEFRDRHPNVRYVRQERNLGSYLNFKYVLDEATTPYFMWLGGHDFLGDGYVAATFSALKDAVDSVGAYGELNRVEMKGDIALEMTTLAKPSPIFLRKLASSDPIDRMYYMVRKCPTCVIIHSLFRTDILKRICEMEPHLGNDLHILAKLAKEGRFVQVGGTYYAYRDFTTNQVAQGVDPIERWIRTLNPPDATYRITGYGYLRRGIYSAFKAIPAGDGRLRKLKKSYLKRRLKKYLEQSFGPFTYP